MFCTNCGAKNADDAKFCTECGTPLFQPQQTVEAPQQTPAAPAAPEVPASPSVSAYGSWTPAAPSAPEPPKKKKSKAPLFIVLAVLVIAVALVALNFNALAGVYMRNVASPLKYYEYVEYQGIDTTKQDLSTTYDNVVRASLVQTEQGQDTALTFTLGETGATLLKTATGMDFSWLESIGLSFQSTRVGATMGTTASLTLNGKHLVGGELLVDSENGRISGSVPELFDTWFELDTAELDAENAELAGALTKLFTEAGSAWPDRATTERLIDRYLRLAVEQIKQVERGSGTLTAEGVTGSYNTLIVTLTEDEVRSIARTLTEELGKDEDVRAILQKLGTSMERNDLTDRFQSLLDEAAEQIDEIELDDDIQMILWVDNKGTIHGRQFRCGDAVIRWSNPESEGNTALELVLEDGEDELFRFAGAGETARGVNSGSYTMWFEGEPILKVETEGLDLERARSGYLSGQYTISPTRELLEELDMDGLAATVVQNLSIVVNVDSDAKGSELTADIRMGSDSLLTVRCASASTAPGELPTVGETMEMEEWLDEFSTTEATQKLLGILMKSDIPLSLLMGLG